MGFLGHHWLLRTYEYFCSGGVFRGPCFTVHRYFRGCSKLCLSHRTAVQDFFRRGVKHRMRAAFIVWRINDQRAMPFVDVPLVDVPLALKQNTYSYSHRVRMVCTSTAVMLLWCSGVFSPTIMYT